MVKFSQKLAIRIAFCLFFKVMRIKHYFQDWHKDWYQSTHLFYAYYLQKINQKMNLKLQISLKTKKKLRKKRNQLMIQNFLSNIREEKTLSSKNTNKCAKPQKKIFILLTLFISLLSLYIDVLFLFKIFNS